MGIFKAYDIRGIYPDGVNTDIAYKIGKAYARFLNAKTLVLGRDMRTSSPEIANAAIQGMASTGAKVYNIGLVSTPMTYFAVGHMGLDGGLMVTASHNPAGYNGFKLCREKTIPISAETGILEIERMVMDDNQDSSATHHGSISHDILPAYLEHVLSFAKKNTRPLKIVLDTANGMGGKIFPEILKALPCEVIPLYWELDGTFPNHEANPLKEENLHDLKVKVLENGADLGVSVDGDADRSAFVDEKGQTIGCDMVTALIAKDVLKAGPSAIVYDLRSSWAVPEEITKNGGTPIEERVGHSFLKATMRKHDAAFGGELSGHYYFKENFYADSAIIAMVKVLNILSDTEAPFSERIKPLKRYCATGEVNFEVADKDGMIARLKEKFSDGQIKELDGLTVTYEDWWFNVRKSNTEPLLRLNLEGRTEKDMAQGKSRLLEILKG